MLYFLSNVLLGNPRPPRLVPRLSNSRWLLAGAKELNWGGDQE